VPADADAHRTAPPHEVHAIGAPARRALSNAGLTTWDAVDAAPDADLLALHGFGPRALALLRETTPRALLVPGSAGGRSSPVENMKAGGRRG
jgi:hypothetical protein